MNPSTLNDAQLLELCRQYDARALESRRKFIGLLPEVNRRRIYETNGFSSIFEFAAKLCGLSEDVKSKLLELQEKGIDINAMILEMLEKREGEIQEEKEKIVEETQENSDVAKRYIPARIKRILKQEHGEKCSIFTCQKPSKEIHHTQRYALGRNHDPHYLAPLCREHHMIAHSIDLRVHRKWRRPY